MSLGSDFLNDYAYEIMLAEEEATKWEIYEDDLCTDLVYAKKLYKSLNKDSKKLNRIVKKNNYDLH